MRTSNPALIALALLAAADFYTSRMWPVNYSNTSWTPEKTYRSMFGTIKILKSGPRDGEDFNRMYFQDGLVQNMVGAHNQSMSLYTYALEALAQSYRPGVKKALVLGNGVRLSLAEQTAREGNPLGWPRLRSASILSMILWVLVTLFGAILPNV